MGDIGALKFQEQQEEGGAQPATGGVACEDDVVGGNGAWNEPGDGVRR